MTTIVLNEDGSATSCCGAGLSPVGSVVNDTDLAMIVAETVRKARGLSVPCTIQVSVDWTADAAVTVEVV